MPDVCFVNMPYAPIIQPSLALGLLQGIVQRDGLTSEIVYGNLLFTAEIGLASYRLIIKTLSSDGLRDWTFGHIAFPDFAPDHRAYLAQVTRRNRLLDDCDPERFREALFEARDKAVGFVTRLVERVLEHRPSIVACTSSMNQHVPSLALLRKIRELAPRVMTLMGGANCEAEMGYSTHQHFPWVDFVVSGEADGLISPLIRTLLAQGRDVPAGDLPEGVFAPCHRHPGLQASTGVRCAPSHRAVFRDMESLPVPDFDEYFSTLEALPAWLREMILPALPVETSRGCWWGEKAGCRFCGMHESSRPFRSKSAKKVLAEIDELSERYGLDRMQAVDNVMSLDSFDTLLPELRKRAEKLRLFFDVRPGLKRRQVRLMKQAGLNWIWAGIESLHGRVLALMNKGVSAHQNIQLLKWCRQYGIFVGWNMMCDFPGEQDSWYGEMADCIPLLAHLQPPGACSRLRFDRFSAYHDHAGRFGLQLAPAKLYEYIYPLNETDLYRQVYFFEDPDRAANPLFSPLLERPGIRAMHRKVHEWTGAFYSKRRPMLSMRITRDSISITDTRPVATRKLHSLEGVAGRIYLACDRAPRENRLRELLENRGVSRDEVAEAIAGMIDNKLLLSLDGRLVALAVREPWQEMPELDEYPGGLLASRKARQRFERNRPGREPNGPATAGSSR